MAKPSHRAKILAEGMRVVHERGFGAASVRDIVQAAGVPQGSFTNHFTSKEAFGLEVIDLYFANATTLMRETLRNDSLPPLDRLRRYIHAGRDRLNRDSMRNGCLFGNFTAEATESSEAIREKLLGIFTEVRESLAYCLKAAIDVGELPPDFDWEETAPFIVAALQGANLLAKAERSPAPVERFERVLFRAILR